MIYREFTVKIPSEAHVYKNGHVFLVTKPYPKNIRRIIGESCGEGLMHPSGLYFQLFPAAWKEQYPDKAPMIHQDTLGVGLLALTLGIGESTGIYSLLTDAYGAKTANGILDFALYDLLFSIDSADFSDTFDFPEELIKSQLVFSIVPRERDWYANLFHFGMNEDRNNSVRKSWFAACLKSGLTSVWVSIEGIPAGYKEDDQHQDKVLQKESEKIGADEPAVSCIFVICADGDHKGLPLTYFVFKGNPVDTQALKKVFAFLDAFSLSVKGVLAKSDYCTEDLLQFLCRENRDYLIQVPENAYGFQEIMGRYQSIIRENVQYSMEDGQKYGAAAAGKVFEASDFESKLVLIYDDLQGSSQRSALLTACYRVKEDWDTCLKKGKERSIPEEYKRFVTVSDQHAPAKLNFKQLQEALDSKGYAVFASSMEESISSLEDTMHLTDAEEKSFAAAKTLFSIDSEGLDAGGFHGKEAAENLTFCLFICAIMQSELINSCRRHDVSAEDVLRESYELSYRFMNNQYDFVRTLPPRLASVYSDFNLSETSIRSLDDYVRKRYDAEEGKFSLQEKLTVSADKNSAVSGICAKPLDAGPFVVGGDLDSCTFEEFKLKLAEPGTLRENERGENGTANSAMEQEQTQRSDPCKDSGDLEAPPMPKKRGRKPKPKPEKPPGPGRGRVKGSKNAKTLERERLIAEGVLQVPPKRPRGRPKSDKTVAKEREWQKVREAARQRGEILPEKPPNGRPSRLVMEIRKELSLTEEPR